MPDIRMLRWLSEVARKNIYKKKDCGDPLGVASIDDNIKKCFLKENFHDMKDARYN